jgi:hypothetical protein
MLKRKEVGKLVGAEQRDNGFSISFTAKLEMCGDVHW